jgi:hypothetical protein
LEAGDGSAKNTNGWPLFKSRSATSAKNQYRFLEINPLSMMNAWTHLTIALSRTRLSGLWPPGGLVCAAIVLWAAVAPPATGQDPGVRFGIKQGVALMTITGDDLPTVGRPNASDVYDRRVGLAIGGLAIVPLPGPLALQPELLYVQKGATVSDGRVTVTQKLDYIELPLLAAVDLPPVGALSPRLLAGPYAGINVANDEVAELPSPGTPLPYPPSLANVRTYTFGLTVGGAVGWDLGAGTLMVDLRYGLDLSSLQEQVVYDSDTRNQGFMLTAGFAF